jgi:hypothetical protein
VVEKTHIGIVLDDNDAMYIKQYSALGVLIKFDDMI